MQQPIPALTPDQRATYEMLSRIQMAWVALWFALGLFTIGFFVFLIALFAGKNAIGTSISGGIDLLLGWALHQVYGHLFPTTSKDSATLPAIPERPKLDQ